MKGFLIPGVIGGFVIMAGAGAAGYELHPTSTTTTIIKPITHTVTVTITPSAVPAKVVTRTITRTVPGPTVTIDAGSAQLATDQTCIAVLYDNISGWKSSGGQVPSGWWDSRCPVPG